LRYFKDWIEASTSVSQGSKLPLIFRKWSAVSAVAGAMGRHCWFSQGDYTIFPNMYIILIARPGIGKTAAMGTPYSAFEALCEPVGVNKKEKDASREIWEQYLGSDGQPLHIIRDRITPEMLGHEMSKVSRPVFNVPEPFHEAPVTIMTDEFGSFMAPNERYLQKFLTQAWDSKDSQEYYTKTSGVDIIKGPCLNWIAGATPSEFVDNLPQNANEQGLLSRIIPVFYNGEKPPRTLKIKGADKGEVEKLKHDLADIANTCGEYHFEQSTEDRVQEWIDAGEHPQPKGAAFDEYNNRRLSHLIKLCMVLSAARGPHRIITDKEWDDACSMLFEVESTMALALRRFGMANVGKMADDLESYIRFFGGQVSSSALKREAMRISQNSGDVDKVIALMTDSGMIRERGKKFVLAEGGDNV
jgi:hypothetical protein